MGGRTEVKVEAEPRVPLSRVRVLRAAVEVADRDGLDSLTMRKLAQELGVEAMSLYYHVANKEAILDGVIEVVMAEIDEAVSQVDAPSAADDWQAAMRARVLAARTVLLQHLWAPRVLETRTAVNPAVVGYFEDVLRIFHEGGFSYRLSHHAMHVLGSRALGFSQELFQPDDPEAGGTDSMVMLEQMADQFPHLVAMVAQVTHEQHDSTLGWCDDQFEFEFALDLILDGLERRRITD